MGKCRRRGCASTQAEGSYLSFSFLSEKNGKALGEGRSPQSREASPKTEGRSERSRADKTGAALGFWPLGATMEFGGSLHPPHTPPSCNQGPPDHPSNLCNTPLRSENQLFPLHEGRKPSLEGFLSHPLTSFKLEKRRAKRSCTEAALPAPHSLCFHHVYLQPAWAWAWACGPFLSPVAAGFFHR